MTVWGRVVDNTHVCGNAVYTRWACAYTHILTFNSHLEGSQERVTSIARLPFRDVYAPAEEGGWGAVKMIDGLHLTT